MSWLDAAVAAAALAALAALLVWRRQVVATSRELGAFLVEARAEVGKITWPTADDLRKATLVIIVFVIVVSLVIGAMDIVLQTLLVNLPSGGS